MSAAVKEAASMGLWLLIGFAAAAWQTYRVPYSESMWDSEGEYKLVRLGMVALGPISIGILLVVGTIKVLLRWFEYFERLGIHRRAAIRERERQASLRAQELEVEVRRLERELEAARA